MRLLKTEEKEKHKQQREEEKLGYIRVLKGMIEDGILGLYCKWRDVVAVFDNDSRFDFDLLRRVDDCGNYDDDGELKYETGNDSGEIARDMFEDMINTIREEFKMGKERILRIIKFVNPDKIGQEEIRKSFKKATNVLR